MILEYKKSESTEYPSLIDVSSSKNTVYLRRKVTETQREDMDGNSLVYYEYEEAKLTKNEYEEYKGYERKKDESELVDAVLELAANISDIEDAIAELGEILS